MIPRDRLLIPFLAIVLLSAIPTYSEQPQQPLQLENPPNFDYPAPAASYAPRNLNLRFSASREPSEYRSPNVFIIRPGSPQARHLQGFAAQPPQIPTDAVIAATPEPPSTPSKTYGIDQFNMGNLPEQSISRPMPLKQTEQVPNLPSFSVPNGYKSTVREVETKWLQPVTVNSPEAQKTPQELVRRPFDSREFENLMTARASPPSALEKELLDALKKSSEPAPRRSAPKNSEFPEFTQAADQSVPEVIQTPRKTPKHSGFSEFSQAQSEPELIQTPRRTPINSEFPEFSQTQIQPELIETPQRAAKNSELPQFPHASAQSQPELIETPRRTKYNVIRRYEPEIGIENVPKSYVPEKPYLPETIEATAAEKPEALESKFVEPAVYEAPKYASRHLSPHRRDQELTNFLSQPYTESKPKKMKLSQALAMYEDRSPAHPFEYLQKIKSAQRRSQTRSDQSSYPSEQYPEDMGSALTKYERSEFMTQTNGARRPSQSRRKPHQLDDIQFPPPLIPKDEAKYFSDWGQKHQSPRREEYPRRQEYQMNMEHKRFRHENLHPEEDNSKNSRFSQRKYEPLPEEFSGPEYTNEPVAKIVRKPKVTYERLPENYEEIEEEKPLYERVPGSQPSRSHQFGKQEPRSRQFDDQESRQFEDQEPRSRQFEDHEPRSRQFEDHEPRSRQFEDQEPRSRQFEDQEPRSRQFEDHEPRSRQFEDQEPRSRQFEDHEPRSRQFEDHEPRSRQFEDQEPRSRQFEDHEPRSRQFEDHEPRSRQFEDQKPRSRQFEDQEPRARLFEDQEPRSRQLEERKFEDDEYPGLDYPKKDEGKGSRTFDRVPNEEGDQEDQPCDCEDGSCECCKCQEAAEEEGEVTAYTDVPTTTQKIEPRRNSTFERRYGSGGSKQSTPGLPKKQHYYTVTSSE